MSEPEWGIETDEPSWAWANPAPAVPPSWAFVPREPHRLLANKPAICVEPECLAWHNPPPDPIDRTGLPVSLRMEIAGRQRGFDPRFGRACRETFTAREMADDS